MQIKIDPEFKKLIPPLSEEEFCQLEENIITDGCRDAIVLWQGIIIDGHNRHEICTENCIDFKTVEKEFESREDVIIWIINNQFGRRNIIPYIRGRLALRLKEEIAKKAKENQLSGLKQFKEEPEPEDSTVCQNSDKREEQKPAPIDTKKEVAKAAGISHDTISRIEKIEKQATPEVKKKLESGDLSINQAYNDIRSEEKKKAREQQIEEVKKKILEEPEPPEIIRRSYPG